MVRVMVIVRRPFFFIMEHLNAREYVFPYNQLFFLPYPNYQTHFEFFLSLKVLNTTYATHFWLKLDTLNLRYKMNNCHL